MRDLRAIRLAIVCGRMSEAKGKGWKLFTWTYGTSVVHELQIDGGQLDSVEIPNHIQGLEPTEITEIDGDCVIRYLSEVQQLAS